MLLLVRNGRLATEDWFLKDSSLDDLNAPDHKLLATATSLQREISLNLTFFRSIIEAQEGFLSHVVNQKSKGLKWVPQRSEEKLRLVVKKATGQKTRLEMLRNRAQNILNFVRSAYLLTSL